jgi:hypothetical protein
VDPDPDSTSIIYTAVDNIFFVSGSIFLFKIDGLGLTMSISVHN